MLQRYCGTLLLLCVLASSLSLNVMLGWRLQSRPSPITMPVAVIKPGTHLEPIYVQNASGIVGPLAINSLGKAIIYFMSPSCTWCDRNYDNIMTLWEHKHADYSFVGISVTGYNLTAHLQKHPLPFPVFRLDGIGLAQVGGLIATPLTIVVAPGGSVDHVWTGAYLGATQTNINQFFHITLPGVALH